MEYKKEFDAKKVKEDVIAWIRNWFDINGPGCNAIVAISGGKDSLTLLYALHGLKRFYPNHFELSAVTVDLGFENFDLSPVQRLCDELEVPYRIVPSDIYNILFKIREEENPCSLCAKMRKGALNDKAKEIGAGKIAYAHHRDDLIETMMMSLIYEGRFHAFSPVTYLDRMQLYVIRPFLFVEEGDIISFARDMKLPVCKNPCPVDGNTKRQYTKELLGQIYRENPGADKRLFRAILDGNLAGWPEAVAHPRYEK